MQSRYDMDYETAIKAAEERANKAARELREQQERKAASDKAWQEASEGLKQAYGFEDDPLRRLARNAEGNTSEGVIMALSAMPDDDEAKVILVGEAKLRAMSKFYQVKGKPAFPERLQQTLFDAALKEVAQGVVDGTLVLNDSVATKPKVEPFDDAAFKKEIADVEAKIAELIAQGYE